MRSPIEISEGIAANAAKLSAQTQYELRNYWQLRLLSLRRIFSRIGDV